MLDSTIGDAYLTSCTIRIRLLRYARKIIEALRGSGPER